MSDELPWGLDLSWALDPYGDPAGRLLPLTPTAVPRHGERWTYTEPATAGG